MVINEKCKICQIKRNNNRYPEAMDEIEDADLLISKGQGNFEGLSGCGLNIYYFFLCKCEMFMRRFGVEQFTGIMTKESYIES